MPREWETFQGKQRENAPATGKVLDDIRAFLLKRLHSLQRADAEDLAQKTLVVLLSKYGSETDPSKLRAIALGILQKHRLAWWRKITRRGERTSLDPLDIALESRDGDPEQLLRMKRFEKRLARELEALGEPCRTIMRLILDERGTEDIRDAIGATSINAVYISVSRCRRKLQDRLGEDIRDLLWTQEQRNRRPHQ